MPLSKKNSNFTNAPVQNDTLVILDKLIGFDTVSAKSNINLIHYVADHLGAFGIETKVLPSPDGHKANLWAIIGPKNPGGIVLSGHSDVVPVEGQPWTTDPFKMELIDDRLYGRGTTDMKGFIACAIAALQRHQERPLQRPVHLAISYDEEIGCLGAPDLINWLAHQPFAPALAIIGEPTSMKLVTAHKGVLVARTEIQGVEAHSSMAHAGVSAVDMAGSAISILKTLEREFSEKHKDSRFLPDYSSVSVNQISGGTAINILAGSAWFHWDVRSIPAVGGADILTAFEARVGKEILVIHHRNHPGITIKTKVLANVPALVPEADGIAEAQVKAILEDKAANTVAFGTEGGQFQQAGISTVVIGPGSMEQGHKVDEFVTLEQLGQCEKFLDQLIEAYSS